MDKARVEPYRKNEGYVVGEWLWELFPIVMDAGVKSNEFPAETTWYKSLIHKDNMGFAAFTRTYYSIRIIAYCLF
jgi:hypothetical protein